MKDYIRIKFVGGIILTLSIFALLGACSDERLIRNPSGDVQNGAVQVKLRLSLADMKETDTRSASEVNELCVMTFDKDGNMTDAPRKALILNPGISEEYYVATLTATTEKRQVVILVNVGSALDAYLNNSAIDFPNGLWKVMGESGVDASSATNLFHLQANLKSISLPYSSSGFTTEQPFPSPMMGQFTLDSGIHNATIICDGYENDGKTPKPIELERVTAKFTVEVSRSGTSVVPVVNDFRILGTSLGNAPADGFVFKQPSLPATGTTLRHYANSVPGDDLDQMLVDAQDNYTSAPLYSYETDKSCGTFILLKGEYKGKVGYYRLNLVDGIFLDDISKRTLLDITRNTWFRVSIKNVESSGYSTAAEAALAPATNIQYTVTATVTVGDEIDDPHDIVSNGQYYLGVSNSRYVVYDNGEQNDLAAFRLTHNAPAGVNAVVTISGTGLSFDTGGSVKVLPTADGTVQKIDIGLNMGADFKNTDTGGFTIKIGNLTKVIAVRRESVLPFVEEYLNDYSTPEYIQATVKGAPSWIRLYKDVSSTDGYSEMTNINGGFCIRYEKNVADKDTYVRSADIYLSRNDNQGRVKAHMVQKNLNKGSIVDDEINLPDNFHVFVGAFWRAEQTGERLIRITRPTGTAEQQGACDGFWDATVTTYDDRWNLSEGDGIVLDKVMTSDPNVGWRAGANEALVANGNDVGFDDTYKVKSRSQYVWGELSAADPQIYFRIGLQKPYEPTAQYSARYALILLTYTYRNGATTEFRMQRIFVRQGHDADYIMRPGDPDGSGKVVVDNRAYARKFSSYNLSDPIRGNGGSSATNHTSMPTIVQQASWMVGKTRLDNGKQVTIRDFFTDYPSQAGYIFDWAGGGSGTSATRRAYHPTNPVGDIANWPAFLVYRGTYWDNIKANVESCPQNISGAGAVGTVNYRRPTDGITNGPSLGGVASSELRQSLFLNPPTGTYTNSKGNIIWGFYADGFSDRRKVGTSVQGVTASTISSGSSVAYIGRLMYNPFSNASIFMPAVGFRGGDKGYLSGASLVYPEYMAGNAVTLITASQSTSVWNGTYHFWAYLSSFKNAFLLNGFGTWDGYPVRCVAD